MVCKSNPNSAKHTHQCKKQHIESICIHVHRIYLYLCIYIYIAMYCHWWVGVTPSASGLRVIIRATPLENLIDWYLGASSLSFSIYCCRSFINELYVARYAMNTLACIHKCSCMQSQIFHAYLLSFISLRLHFQYHDFTLDMHSYLGFKGCQRYITLWMSYIP